MLRPPSSLRVSLPPNVADLTAGAPGCWGRESAPAAAARPQRASSGARGPRSGLRGALEVVEARAVVPENLGLALLRDVGQAQERVDRVREPRVVVRPVGG